MAPSLLPSELENSSAAEQSYLSREAAVDNHRIKRGVGVGGSLLEET